MHLGTHGERIFKIMVARLALNLCMFMSMNLGCHKHIGTHSERSAHACEHFFKIHDCAKMVANKCCSCAGGEAGHCMNPILLALHTRAVPF